MSNNRKLGELANVLDDGTEGQVLSFNASGKIAASTISTEGTLGTLTQSFDSNQTSSISLSSAANTVPFVSVFKEVPQIGISSKSSWDVNSNGANYDFYDEKPYSTYASSTLTPSATGDGTFTNSSAIVTPYILSNLSYDSKSFDASTQLGNAEGIAFKSDGTAMYLIGFSNDKVWQYTLSTAYDISTASYSNKSFSVASQDGVPRDVRFKPDGTIMYVIASTAPDSVYQYTLSTAWDVSTASYANKSLSVQSQSNNPAGLVLSPNGDKVYVAGHSNKTVFQYNLSTAWDLSTGSYSNNSFATTNNFNYSHSALELNSDASKLFIGAGDYYIGEYSLPSDGNVSNASYIATYDVRNTTVGSKNIGGMSFANNGAKFYIFGNNDMHAYQFSSTASLAFNSSDVGKKVVGNSGSAVITGTSGTYKSVTAFADTSAISSWQLFGAQGKSDGSGITLSGHQSSFNISSSTLLYTWNTSSFSSTLKNIAFKPDGTRAIFDDANAQIHSVNLSTPWDLSTASHHYSKGTGSLNGGGNGIYFKPDGTILWLTTGSAIYPHYLSSAWDITSTWTNYSGSHAKSLGSTVGSARDVHFSTDGTKMYVLDFTNRRVTEWDCSTAFRADTATYNNVLLDVYYNSSNLPMGMEFNSSGTVLLVISEQRNLLKYNLSTAWDLSTATYDSLKAVGSSGSCYGLGIDTAGENFYVTIPNVSGDPVLQYYAAASNSAPYSQYMPALTNSSTGQINSSSWLDINSMTADETKNDGDIFYAVSTDNRASWGVAKASDGVRKIVKNNSGTWQYNNNTGSSTAVGFSLASPSYDNKSYSVSHSNPRGMYLKPDGTELYIGAYTGHVYQFTLSTPNDISTASSTGNYNIDEHNDTLALSFKPDGTKMYAADGTNMYQYTLSTAWDVTTASYDSVSYTPSDMGSSDIHSLNFNSDGTKLFMSDDGSSDKRIREYSLSTPYVISSASTTSNYLYHAKANVRGVDFNSDGTKIFLSGVSDRKVYQYNLASPYTLSSSQGTTADAEYHVVSVISGGMYSIAFSNDGTKLFILETNGNTVKQFSTTTTGLGYGTGETWVNGTNNNEHATLQQALTSQAFNRMDKAQLDAVADGYHFSQDSADTLDLMIAPYAASGTSPISDGVTINYDAASKYKQAIHGTEYDVEFTTTNSVDLTSKISANLKARVL
jgi:sugar lactone lactonase YvrE